eukprot:NODE_9179_length_658_cov_81.842991_g8915_i0.p1 GENE.NODE_9179_length_658_cov_81.842991_g8915_i0~~NODE_9179_length_658_cov_81.842991_g8915_i0.p1  ORF type:complete len:190 (+),score=0.27 NODE_9179_length_658_cov_81.842991_g8915_i0:67-570(+)
MAHTCEHDCLCMRCNHVTHFEGPVWMIFINSFMGAKCRCGARKWTSVAQRCPLSNLSRISECDCVEPGHMCDSDVQCKTCKYLFHVDGPLIMTFMNGKFGRACPCGIRDWTYLGEAHTYCPRTLIGDFDRVMLLWAHNRGTLRNLPQDTVRLVLSFLYQSGTNVDHS